LSDSVFFSTGALFSTDYLGEAIKETAAYRVVDVAGLRARLDAIAAAFPQNARTNESQTEDDFIWPVLAALGWSETLRQQNLTVTGRDDVPDGLLFADVEAKVAANALDDQWRRYGHGLAVVESKRWARPLDRASGRDETTAPSTQMLRYLRRIDDTTGGKLRWGILTNGVRWRLYWAGARSISEEFLEIDLGRVMALDGHGDLFADDETRDHWLRVFAVMFGREAFLRTGVDQRSFHDAAKAEAAFYEERVAASLSRLVFDQVFPDLARALADSAPQAPLHEVRDAALVLLYRLLFLLYAEDRDLLPVSDGRYDDYALRPLRLDVGERVTNGDAFSTSAARVWSHVSDLSRIIDKGDASVGIPPYNGGLFAGAGTPLLASARIPDSVMAPALDALSYERSTGERRYINYRDLSVQQLGSIYERLLEFEIVREPGEVGDTGYLTVRPNLFARKNSGSYYTPDELVGLILDETLEPLIAERREAFRSALAALNPKDGEDLQRRTLRDADPAEAILSLRVCDPAMGSGHFLVSLVDTLADHVLDAMAEAAALGVDIGYTSPLADKIEDIDLKLLHYSGRAAEAVNGWEDRVVDWDSDWSEYFGRQTRGEAVFHLDPLWADPNIDHVSIDWYPPLSDWREGDGGVDAAMFSGAADPAYLATGVAGGEGFDWYYADEADRAAQARTAIVDTAHGEDWLFRPKDLKSWWSNLHHDRPGGVRAATPTAWVPGMKPVRLSEFGCAAVDRGGNAPNLFQDPKSSESRLPPGSTGARDDAVQRAALEAVLAHYATPKNNPVSAVYGGPMLEGADAWCWDARPYPAFPARNDVWADAGAWRAGHWLNGRLAGDGRDLIAAVLARGGLAADEMSVEGVQGAAAGYVIDRPMRTRDALEPLLAAFDAVAAERDGRVAVLGQVAEGGTVARGALALPDEGAAETATRTLEARPGEARVRFIDETADYQTGAVVVRADVVATGGGVDLDLPLACGGGLARAAAMRALDGAAAEAVSLGLGPLEALRLEPGDVLRLEGRDGDWRVMRTAADETPSVVLEPVGERRTYEDEGGRSGAGLGADRRGAMGRGVRLGRRGGNRDGLANMPGPALCGGRGMA